MADYVTPFIQGFALMQGIQRERQRITEIEQLRAQQAEQNATQAALGFLREGNQEAAQKIYDNALAPKYGPAKILNKVGNQYHMILGDGRVVGIDPTTNTATPVRFAAPDLSQTQFEVGQEGAGVPMAPSPAQQEIAQAGQPIIARVPGQRASAGTLADQIVRGIAGLPTDRELTEAEAMRGEEVYKRLRTTPEGAESRSFDIMTRWATGQPVSEGEKAVVQTLYPEFARNLQASKAQGRIEGETKAKAAPSFQQTEAATAASRAGGAETGRTTAERNLPLGKNATTYFHPGTLKQPPSSMTAVQAEQAGYIPTPPGRSAAVESARAFLSRITEMRKMLHLLPEGTGNYWVDIANVGATWTKLRARAPVDKEAQNFLNIPKSTAQAAKAFGDAANISIIEQKQITDQIPSGGQTREVAESMLKQLETFIRSAAARGFEPEKTGGGAVQRETPILTQPSTAEDFIKKYYPGR